MRNKILWSYNIVGKILIHIKKQLTSRKIIFVTTIIPKSNVNNLRNFLNEPFFLLGEPPC